MTRQRSPISRQRPFSPTPANSRAVNRREPVQRSRVVAQEIGQFSGSSVYKPEHADPLLDEIVLSIKATFDLVWKISTAMQEFQGRPSLRISGHPTHEMENIRALGSHQDGPSYRHQPVARSGTARAAARVGAGDTPPRATAAKAARTNATRPVGDLAVAGDFERF